MLPPRHDPGLDLLAQARLAARVAHRFNNCLAAIIANLEMAAEDAAAGRDIDPALIDLALGAARRAVGTCRNLQDFARPPGAPPSSLALAAFLATMAGDLPQLEITETGGDVAVLAEESELIAALHILASPSGPILSKRVRLGVSKSSGESEWVTLTLEGDGPALPSEALSCLFEPLAGQHADFDRAWAMMRRAGGRVDAALDKDGRLLIHLSLPRAAFACEGSQ